MILKICLIIFFINYEFKEIEGGAEVWGYKDLDGPLEWCKTDIYSACCGHQQSPIALNHKTAQRLITPNVLLYTGYDTPASGNVTDNGHSVVVTVDQTAILSDLVKNEHYKLASFHFHWGLTNSKGSEHSVDNIHYPVEVHFVHINTKYGTLDSALKYPDGLVVLAVFLKPLRLKECEDKPNPAFEPILDAISHDLYVNDVVPLTKKIILSHLLPKDRVDFFSYKGSLTTPPCSEVVTWVLFKEIVHISQEQINDLRFHVHSSTKQEVAKEKNPLLLDDNFRPIQSAYNRTVYSVHIKPRY